MSKILGFAPIPTALPALAFVSGAAACRFGTDVIEAHLFPVARRDQAAVGFEFGSAVFNGWMLERMARCGELAATAFTHEDEDSGLTIVDEVYLHRAVHVAATAWVDGMHRDSVGSTARDWFAHVLVANMRAVAGNAPLSLPPDTRKPGDGAVQLQLVGEIDDGMARKIVPEIEAARGKTIALEIDSIGGNIDPGMRIYNALVRHDRLVMGHVVGMANSMAATILCAADHRSMERDASIFVHLPALSTSSATAGSLRRYASDLDRSTRDIAATIAKATGKSIEIAQIWMEEDTRFNAAEAYAAGFAHRIVSDHAPAAPTARRVRMAPIRGAFASYTPGAPKRVTPYEWGRRYSRGERVLYGGRMWMARRPVMGKPGNEPGRHDAWK